MNNVSLIESIFLKAVEQPSPEALASFLDANCNDDATRQEVVRLLAAHRHVGSFLNEAAAEFPATVDAAQTVEEVGTQIGPYRLLQQIGEGGFGLVYMAEQKVPMRRKVALKIIKPGMDTKEIIGRFEAERQALAMMDHPNIAKVLDAGTTQSGRPYFVMELVRGAPITEFCDDNNLNARERLELFIPVCHAIQHAHQKAVIHRDIKPSNVLVTMHDDKAVPKVIDFGIAKALHTELTARTVFTQFQQLIGTPVYMSPEQAQMSGLDIDTRCDVYALGVLLYELLTGTTPFDPKELLKGGYDDICRRIREQEPPKPSSRVSTMDNVSRTSVAKSRKTDADKLGWLIRGDLDWIVMKAMEKDRTRRYDTASGLARDVERFLASEPVSAVAPSSLYRLRKFVRRNRAAVTTIAAFSLLLIVGTIVSSWFAVVAGTQRDRATAALAGEKAANDLASRKEAEARSEAERASRLYYNRSMKLAGADWEENNLNRLARELEATRDFENKGFEWYYWQRQMNLAVRTFREGKAFWALAVANDGTRIASGFENPDRTGGVVIWNLQTGGRVAELPHGGLVRSVDFSHNDSQLVATSNRDSGLVWDLVTKTSRAVEVPGCKVVSAIFSPDGSQLLVGCNDGAARLLDASTFEEITKLDGQHTIGKTNEGVFGLAFSPDGTRIATSAWNDAKLCIFDVEGNLIQQMQHPTPGLMQAISFAPDGNSVASGSGIDPVVRVWDVNTGQLLRTLEGHDAGVWDLDWAGDLIFSAGADLSARVWDAVTGNQSAYYRGHSGQIWKIKSLPGGDQFVTCSPNDDTAKLWNVADVHGARVLRDLHPKCIAYFPSGADLAVGCSDGSVKIVRVASGAVVSELPSRHDGPVTAIAVFSDGQRVVSTGEDHSVRIWDVTSANAPVVLPGHQASIRSVAISPDGRRLVTGDLQQKAIVWDLDHPTPKILFETAVHAENVEDVKPEDFSTFSVAISPDGKRIATSGEDSRIRMWNLDHLESAIFNVSCKSQGGVIPFMVFSPSGDRLMTAGFNPYVFVWDARNGDVLTGCYGHTRWTNGLVISKDGKRLVSVSHDGTARVWDVATGDELLTLKHSTSVKAVAISPNGRQIVTRVDREDAELWVWTAASDQEVQKWAAEDAVAVTPTRP